MSFLVPDGFFEVHNVGFLIRNILQDLGKTSQKKKSSKNDKYCPQKLSVPGEALKVFSSCLGGIKENEIICILGDNKIYLILFKIKYKN